MAWFDSGRKTTVTYQFTMKARHARIDYWPEQPYPPNCFGEAQVDGPEFQVRLQSWEAYVSGGTSLFQLEIRLQNAEYADIWTFHSTPIPNLSQPYDDTAEVTVTISFPAVERKEVRIPAGSETFDWLPPDVELAYALRPEPDTDVSISLSSQDFSFSPNPILRSSNAFAPETDLAPWLGIHAGYQQPPMSGYHISGFTGLISEVRDVSCSVAGLNFHDSGNPNSGFDFSSDNARCRTTPNSVHLELTHPDGLDQSSGGGGGSTVWPVMQWQYEGQVRAFDTAYPSDPEVYDYARNAVYTAPGGVLSRQDSARRFWWSVALQDFLKAPVSANGQLNGHPSFLKLHLDEAWCLAAGEDPADRRMPLEDDRDWDAVELTRQAVLDVEALDDPQNWAWIDPDTGSISYDSTIGGLKATPEAETNSVRKLVDHDFGTYRYLKVDLRTSLPWTPVRVRLGATFYWDVLVEATDTWETKTLDLAAPHNATSFNDVAALQATAELAFEGLAAGTTYWFRAMRMERTATDHLRVLPPYCLSSQEREGK